MMCPLTWCCQVLRYFCTTGMAKNALISPLLGNGGGLGIPRDLKSARGRNCAANGIMNIHDVLLDSGVGRVLAST